MGGAGHVMVIVGRTVPLHNHFIPHAVVLLAPNCSWPCEVSNCVCVALTSWGSQTISAKFQIPRLKFPNEQRKKFETLAVCW